MVTEEHPLTAGEADRMAAGLLAVADPFRLRIIDVLTRRGRPLRAAEIAVALDLRPARVAQHLRLLGRSRWVEGERQGRAVYYRLRRPDAWAAVRRAATAWIDDPPRPVEVSQPERPGQEA